MGKRLLIISLGAICALVMCGLIFAQQMPQQQPQPMTPPMKQQPMTQPMPQAMPQEQVETNAVSIKGTVSEIAEDGSYIVVNDTKILTTKDFVDETYLEIGDRVEVTAENTKDGLKATSCNYIFEEMPEAPEQEGENPTEEQFEEETPGNETAPEESEFDY